ncbi:MAG: AgmX/PglI C-terminal domain-containing protein [Proteobacteria bacterium]|nr:AgmX/PglI C-terminal domain-containing protein [Pseudomonadota bacterium]
MKQKTWIFTVLVLAVFVLLNGMSYGQPEASADRTLSPYFFVKSDDSEIDRLPLKSTSVQVNISGVIADVVVTQVYENEGKRPLEAIYVFPASTRAAVYGMKMTIGERTIIAKIRERDAARLEYEQAKRAGKSATLLEQHRPNVFQMNVANILPSDVIAVELKYTELLVPTDALYEFVYPTVVGPRYAHQKVEEASPWDKWVENPYLHQGEAPTYTFDINVNLAAGLPIQHATSTSHKVDIDYEGSAFASIGLDPAEKYGGNRDFILKYQLAGGKIQTGLLLFEGAEENFFLLMTQPPKRVREMEIPSREYIFIVDVSGSMHGFPLNISKKLLKDLIGRLRPTDRFNVLLFAGSSSVMSTQSLPATPQNIRNAINVIDRQRGGGGTQLLPALKRALALPKNEGYSRTVVIATDGYVRVEEEAFDLIRNNLGDANMFAFGIGSSVNRHIIEGMAKVGMGEPFVITKPEEAPQQAEKFRKLIQSPVLTGIQVDYGKFEVYDVEPPSIPDVLAERPVIVFGKWRGRPVGTIQLRGITGARPLVHKVDVTKGEPSKANSALRYLWARHRIAILADYNRLKPQDERIKEVTNLGLTYNLLTAYTSFVAVDSQIRLHDGKPVTVKQPLPLPQGVSDYAVGNRAAAQKAHTAVVPSSPKMVLKSGLEGEGRAYTREPIASEDAVSRPRPEEIQIQLARIAVTDRLSRDGVEKVLRKHIASIDKCYRSKVQGQSRLTGEVVFRLVIDRHGRVVKVKMDESQKKDNILEQCVARKLTKIQFPVPQNEKETVLKITLVLT